MLAIRIKTDGISMSIDKNITDVELVEEVNAITKLSFTVYPNTNAYDLIGPSVTSITAYDTFLNKVIFEGRVYSCDDQMTEDGIICKKLECESVMSYFVDSTISNIIFPGTRTVENEDGSTQVVQGTPIGTIIKWIVNNHNSQVEADRQILYGKVTTHLNNKQVVLPETISIDNDNTFNVLKEIVSEKLEWEFQVRYDKGLWYLDVSNQFASASTTRIISGVNMLTISKKATSDDICTRILPLGASGYVRLDRQENTTPFLSSANWADQARLSLNGYDSEQNPHPRVVNGKYIQNDSLVAKYGIITKTVTFDDIQAHDDSDFDSCVDELYRRAVNYADSMVDGEESYETTAVDLARAGYNYDSLYVGYYYRVQNPMMNIDTILRITSKTLKYEDPTASTLKFGKSNITMSNSSYKKNVSITKKLNTNAFNATKNTDVRLGGMSMRNISTKEYSKMSKHLNNTIYVTTDQNSGEIKLYKGDTEIPRGGGGVEVDNAAIITPAQASSLITDEKVIFTDTAIPARVSYGKIGNWFYMNGYPVCLNTYENIKATIGVDEFQKSLDDSKVLNECTLYANFQKSTNHALNRYDYYVEMYRQILNTSDADVKTRFEFRVYYDTYRWQNEAWVNSATKTTAFTPSFYLSNPHRVEKFGFILTTNQVTFNVSSTTPKPEYIETSLVMRPVYKSEEDDVYKLITLSDAIGSSIQGVIHYAMSMDSKAELIFAKGMTKTSVKVDES